MSSATIVFLCGLVIINIIQLVSNYVSLAAVNKEISDINLELARIRDQITNKS